MLSAKANCKKCVAYRYCVEKIFDWVINCLLIYTVDDEIFFRDDCENVL